VRRQETANNLPREGEVKFKVMQAETVYNVYQALPEEEKARLRIMLDRDVTPKKKDIVDNIITVAVYTDAIFALLTKQRNERFKKGSMKVV